MGFGTFNAKCSKIIFSSLLILFYQGNLNQK
jgi:hypothetical protein